MPPKRPTGAGPSQPKRTRFAASPSRSSPVDDPSNNSASNALLEEDLPEGGQRAKQRVKRQLKDKAGYGSDSSNEEGEGVVLSRRKGKGVGVGAQEDEDEDMDMFGDDVDKIAKEDDGEEKGKGKGKGKQKEFMELNDLEGQEFGGEADREEEDRGISDDDEEDEEEDEEARKERRKAGLDGDMGYELTGFNMKTEMDEGKFTADGESYVVNDKDEGEKHDIWLDEVDKEEIRKARRAHKERERVEAERQAQEEEGGQVAQERKEREMGLMREAVGFMERGETVLEALERLGREAEEKRKKEEKEKGKKMTWAEKQKERKAGAADQSNPFTRLSEIVSTLTTIGHLDVYSLSRESIQRMLPSDKTNGTTSTSSPAPPRDTRTFQYRFSMAYVRALPEAQRPVEMEVFGPFVVPQLSQWRNTGFFGGPACENVELRTVGQDGQGEWGSWEQVVGR